MKKFFIFLLAFTLLIGVVKAQEEPKYNFASMQAVKELNIAPGETVITKLYFYNIYGNRITHIKLGVAKAPENWNITIEPALHKTKVKISGVETTVEENLYVEPSEAVEEIPATIPEGIEYISSSVGYIGAKPVNVNITIPKNEKIGKIDEVRIDALASWLGQGGMVSLTQGRSFDYSVNVISKEFIEEVGPELEEPEKLENITEIEKPKEEAIGEVIETTKEIVKEKGISPATFYTTVIVLVIIILILLIFFIKGKKKKEKKIK